MSAPPSPPRRVDDSMSLLVDLMQHAEDPSYGDVASSRAAGQARPVGDPRRRLAGSALVLALAGVLTGTAGAAVRAAADDGGRSRERLGEQVQERTAESDALVRQAAELRREVAALRDEALAGGEAGRLQRLELAAATVAVTGPGVVVLLDERPAEDTTTPALPRGGQVTTGRVLDQDLQELVNGLWAAGAEAVSVNDLRLTTRTAIRSAGEAVLVDFRPLSPPYLVRAIGDPGRLEVAFVDGPTGRRLATYTSLYGLRLEVRGEDVLRLPAGTVPQPRSARAVPDP